MADDARGSAEVTGARPAAGFILEYGTGISDSIRFAPKQQADLERADYITSYCLTVYTSLSLSLCLSLSHSAPLVFHKCLYEPGQRKVFTNPPHRYKPKVYRKPFI